jgi:hypothetical protein
VGIEMKMGIRGWGSDVKETEWGWGNEVRETEWPRGMGEGVGGMGEEGMGEERMGEGGMDGERAWIGRVWGRRWKDCRNKKSKLTFFDHAQVVGLALDDGLQSLDVGG